MFQPIEWLWWLSSKQIVSCESDTCLHLIKSLRLTNRSRLMSIRRLRADHHPACC